MRHSTQLAVLRTAWAFSNPPRAKRETTDLAIRPIAHSSLPNDACSAVERQARHEAIEELRGPNLSLATGEGLERSDDPKKSDGWFLASTLCCATLSYMPNRSERRESPRCLTSMQVLPETFAIAGDLSVGGASFSMWLPPADDLVCLRVELFGTVHRLPARVVRVDKSHHSSRVHVAFDELPVETQLTLARWVQHHTTYN